MLAWKASQREHEVIHERTTKDGTYREVTKTRSFGNPAYLTATLKALDDIRRIWGAESPKQVYVEADIESLSTSEQLERIGDELRKLVPSAFAVEVVDSEGERGSGAEGGGDG